MHATSSSSSLGFRPLAENDLPLLYTWLARPHVAKWYAPAPRSFNELLAKYAPRVAAGDAVKAFIVTAGGEPAGYIQTYAIRDFPDYAKSLGCAPGDYGVDLFLADAWRTGHGVGRAVIRRFVDEEVFGRLGAGACVAGPAEGNAASIAAFEAAGFSRWKSVVNERGERECVLRREGPAPALRAATIELARDAAVCIGFRRDMYLASFGTHEGLDEEMGPDNQRYLAQLRAKLEALPEGNCHWWHLDRIVGQTELRLLPEAPGVGYVSLFYLVPEWRGRGLGRELHEHAANVFRARGLTHMRLSVSSRNPAAIAFYQRLGWEPRGFRPHRVPMQIMEFTLA